MEPPLLLRIASLSCLLLLLARGSAETGVLGRIDADEDEWSRQPAAAAAAAAAAAHLILGDSRNVQARRLLQTGKNEHPQPPTHAPPPNPNQKKPKTNEHPHRPKHHRHKMNAPAPSPFSSAPKAYAPAPSPSSSAPKALPSPSASSGSHHPLAAPPRPLISPSPSIPPPHKHSSRKSSLVAAGSAVFVVMAAASVMYCRVKKVGTVRPWATGLSGQLQRAFVTGVPALKRSELEAACEDFSNIVGSTPRCMLYKGTLSSGVEIAVVSSSVTSVKDWSEECESHYRKKITSLSKISHKNFMNLLGYCEEDQPFTRAMVFEYAPNGTLFEHLHVREADNLDWATRLRISMGIAYCLEHMHQLNPPVVPRNFDSSTIYLTDDFAAKVSDLDFWSDTATTAATKGSDTSSTTDDDFSSVSDLDVIVHQYGMLLLEILTGKVAYSEEEDGVSLEQLASRYFEGNMPLAELIDPSLGSFPQEAAHAVCEVARSCVDPDPKKRPRMAQVAARMKEITALGPEGATPKVSPLWWAELEIMSSEAS